MERIAVAGRRFRDDGLANLRRIRPKAPIAELHSSRWQRKASGETGLTSTLAPHRMQMQMQVLVFSVRVEKSADVGCNRKPRRN